jgi:hypothetical protein
VQSQVPLWIQISQALAVPVIALVGAVIAGAQWYTAHRKTVMDVFDRRLEIYNAMRDVVSKVMQRGSCDDQLLFDFDKATDRVPFLFGKAVNAYVGRLRHDLIDLQLTSTMMQSQDKDHHTWVVKRHEHFKRVVAFYKEFPPVIAPYIVLDQKIHRWRTPEWLAGKKPQP